MIDQAIKDMAAKEGVTLDVIFRILRPDNYEKELLGDGIIDESLERLATIFPNFHFIGDLSFEFIDPSKPGKRLSIGKLLGSPYFNTTTRKTEKFKEVQAHVNTILNKVEHVSKKLESSKNVSDNLVIDRYYRILGALQYREMLRKTSYEKHLNAARKITGTYRVNDKTYIVLSNSPIDVFQKSTGQSWTSCEAVENSFEAGIYDDIKYGNIVCYIYTDSGSAPVGRVMIRNCLAKGEPSFGIEPVWYTVTGKIKNARGGSIDTVAADEIIKKVIKSKGFDIDYATCTTPYFYHGYSDKAKGSNVITYGGEKPTIREIIRDSDSKAESQCPFCSSVVEFELDYTRDNTSLEIVNEEVKEHGGSTISGYYISEKAEVLEDDDEPERYYIVSKIFGDNCPVCGVKRFVSYFDRNTISTLLKRPFLWHYEMDKLDEEEIALVVSRFHDVVFFFWPLISLYKNLLSRSPKAVREIIESLVFSEIKKSKRKRDVYPKRNKNKQAVFVTDRWTKGEDIQEFIVVWIDDAIDIDEAVKKYVVEKFPGSLHEWLLEKQKRKPETKGFKRIEKFCKR